MWPKLEGLEKLRAMRPRSFKTLPFISFEVAEWTSNKKSVLERVRQARLGKVLAIRSCAGMEDSIDLESPGFFESVLNVPSTIISVQEGVEKVISSYERRSLPVFVTDRIIIQRQMLDAKMSGVFRVGGDPTGQIEVDFDDTPLSTSRVTSGAASTRAAISSRISMLPAPWSNIRGCADELFGVFTPPFFVEFAVGGDGVPVVFQIRADRRRSVNSAESQQSRFFEESIKVAELYCPLSVMTDWNPAEILGVRPLPLDVSLYDELLLSGAWCEGRASVGWARPDDPNLMVVVGGRPYVKIKQSLESLLPAGLEASLASRLVVDRLARLGAAKHLHDKVEFRVMWSAYAFDVDLVWSELRTAGFVESEINDLFCSMKRVTRDAIKEAPKLLAADRSRILQIGAARVAFAETSLSTSPSDVAAAIREAFRICVKFGTIPFSRQARLAFTFRYIITHLIESGSLGVSDVSRWQSGLNTIARQLSVDLRKMLIDEMTEEVFMERYGHLRPSTYDIESPRYDERALLSADLAEELDVVSWTPGYNERLSEILADVGIDDEQDAFWHAAACAYQGREELKFHFSSLLSDVLRVIARWGESLSLGKRELRGVPIHTLLDFMDRSGSWEQFADLIRSHKVNAQWGSGGLSLPDVIWNTSELDVVVEPALRPTFIGQVEAEGRPRVIEKNSIVRTGELAGAIVVVEAADPGFDWLFGHRLSGFVTAYGGEFSHIGLRCGEFGIPAALGCGPAVFRRIATAQNLRLDPTRGEVFADGQRVIPS